MVYRYIIPWRQAMARRCEGTTLDRRAEEMADALMQHLDKDARQNE